MAKVPDLLAAFTTLHPRAWDLGLDRLARLLADLGHPETRLPPVIHVAGTNGKGSTVATLRAILEADGKACHAYTSPHLVRFNERIRIGRPGGGTIVTDADLEAALIRCKDVNAGQPITFFEATTAVAFDLFAAHPADWTLVEVGLGGRLDATNVVHPQVTVVTPVSIDHVGFLGPTLASIAREKAGIFKKGVPAVVGPQPEEARRVLVEAARTAGAPLFIEGEHYQAYEEHGRLVYADERGLLDLPLPNLPGRHQIANAGLALAALRAIGAEPGTEALSRGLQSVMWPGRFQRLSGPLAARAGETAEVWLDGGHNAAGGAAIAALLADLDERVSKPVTLVCGMIGTKDSVGFLANFAGLARHLVAVSVPGHDKSREPAEIAAEARALGMTGEVAGDLDSALARAGTLNPGGRIVICGSLYLAGAVLERDEAVPE
ncbi:MAG: bifunctional folylpolyglutamate synthase/dihydrofolate synthase [Hyphomicrobiaceae bacterium]|nr:bifunctional folylpolyglutamate synthase/dihydrofolate synthase [Hyphomicrobiaceae bacterium]